VRTDSQPRGSVRSTEREGTGSSSALCRRGVLSAQIEGGANPNEDARRSGNPRSGTRPARGSGRDKALAGSLRRPTSTASRRAGESKVGSGGFMRKSRCDVGVDAWALGQLRRLLRRSAGDRVSRAKVSASSLLQAEDVLELAVVAIDPQRIVCPRGDQLPLRRHAVPRKQRAFEHGVAFSSQRSLEAESVRPCIAAPCPGVRDQPECRDGARSRLIASVMPSATELI